jgi:hypothetical protein
MPTMTGTMPTGAAVLRHPLVVGSLVALISALVASLLIPAVTRSWQDRPRELALKRGLVQRVAKTSADAVARANAFGFTVATTRFDTPQVGQEHRVSFLSDALRRWDVRSSAIGSELETYFPHTSIPRGWRAYDFGVTTFLRYVAGAEPNTHDLLLGMLRSHFGGLRFADREGESRRRDVAAGHFETGPERLELAVLLGLERDQLTREILAADAQGFSHRFWVFR